MSLVLVLARYCALALSSTDPTSVCRMCPIETLYDPQEIKKQCMSHQNRKYWKCMADQKASMN